MKQKNGETLTYKSSILVQQTRSTIRIIASYMILIWLWQFALSYQSATYTLMNVAIFGMLLFSVIGTIVVQEQKEIIVKYVKSQVTYYLVVTFVYDLFLRIVINDMQYTVPGSNEDLSLSIAKQFLTMFSIIIKLGFPVAFIIWMLQKFAVFKNGRTKYSEMQVLRNIRKATVDKKDDNSDPNINERY